MQKNRVYFRADGHAKMGLGHVFRSLALAEVVQNDFECTFFIRNPLPTLEEQIKSKGVALVCLSEPLDATEEAKNIAMTMFRGDIIVLDGYHFTTDYQRVFKEKGCKVICIDDIHAYFFVADAVINHAGGVTPDDYAAATDTQFFLGLKYALLREPFRKVAKNKLKSKENNIFICLGGADPNNDTFHVLKKIEENNEKNTCYLVLGGAYLYKEKLEEYLKTTTLNIKVLSNLSAEEMVYYMNQCARAVTPPSSVSYEYLSTGGILYLKTIADNQKDIHKYFINCGFALDFETQFQNEALEKALNLEECSALLDGKQEKRLLSIFYEMAITVRKPTENDCKLYFDWANDPLTRQQSYQTATIPFEQHVQWFYKKIKNNNSVLFLFYFYEKPLGQIRFEIENDVATIGFSLDNAYRGKGLGSVILKKGIEFFRKERKNLTIVGFVKKENSASIKAFRSLNFVETEAEEVENSYKYTWFSNDLLSNF